MNQIRLSTPNVYIIYARYYDFDLNRVVSGGVQTYLTNLIPLFREAGYFCYIYQCGVKNEEVVVNNCIVRSISNSFSNGEYNKEAVLTAIMKNFDKKKDVLLFGDHCMTIKNDTLYSLSIQHGIHWDIQKNKSRNDLRMAFSSALFTYKEHKRMNYVKQVVCVDYNFLNWYRAQVDRVNSNLVVIPNFTQIANINNKPKDKIKIIFARRFVPHRGTRIFAETAERLLLDYSNIEITIAGRGPDEGYLHERLDKWDNKVVFTQYTSDQSLVIHSDKHIAVVPTVGSEGTSLSLLEAMSAQCAVVCTNVGGITNIVIDGFNGKMVNARDSNQLYMAIKYLIDNPNERVRIAMTGYETVKSAFSYERWANQWREVIKGIISNSKM